MHTQQNPRFKKSLLAAALLPAALMLGGPAQAQIVIDDWSLDLTNVDDLGTTVGGPLVVEPISQITFFGIAHAQTDDTNGNSLPDPGEFGTTDGLLSATGFQKTGGGAILPGDSRLGVNYEMTFDFSIDAVNVNSPFLDFVHIAPDVPGATTDGLLEIYIDNFAKGRVLANQVTGDGYTDGVKIATFQVVSGDGGVFTPATFDGSDDATFVLISALPGVILDSDGNDIGLPGALLGLTDSNFDGDPENKGFFSVPAPTNGILGNGGGSAIDFYAEEDGSSRIAAIPEPGTLALFGGALLGMVGLRRRKRKC